VYTHTQRERERERKRERERQRERERHVCMHVMYYCMYAYIYQVYGYAFSLDASVLLLHASYRCGGLLNASYTPLTRPRYSCAACKVLGRVRGVSEACTRPPLTRLLHASYTPPLTRLLHASYTPGIYQVANNAFSLDTAVLRVKYGAAFFTGTKILALLVQTYRF
jgi:hypothetical protein